MIIHATERQIGTREYRHIQINVNEKVAEFLENHQLEIVNECICNSILFLSKNNEDVDSICFNPKLKDSFSFALQKIIMRTFINKPTENENDSSERSLQCDQK